MANSCVVTESVSIELLPLTAREQGKDRVWRL